MGVEIHGRRAFLNRIRVTVTALALFTLLGSSLFGNGNQEKFDPQATFAKAEKAIEDKKYDEAILELAQIVKNDPEWEEQAQDRIRKIQQLLTGVNNDVNQLVDTLNNNQDEPEKAVAIINKIKAENPNPNGKEKNLIRQAEKKVRVKTDNKRYADIMSRALAQLNRQDYGAAAKIYLEGSDLAKDLFLESDLGNVFNNQIDRTWGDLSATAIQFAGAVADLKKLSASGAALLGSEKTSRADLAGVLGTMQTLAGWRQQIWADGRFFTAQNEYLVKNSRDREPYLDYSALFVRGPDKVSSPEGILGAIDRMWADVMVPWTSQVRKVVEARYLQAKAAFDQGKYEESAQAFEGLRILARQGLDAVTLWNRVAGIDETGALDPAFKAQLTQLVPLGVWLDHRLALAGEGALASGNLARAQSNEGNAKLDRNGLEAARAEVRAQKDTYAADARAAGLWSAQAQALVSDGYQLLDPLEFPRVWQVTWASLRQKTVAQEAEFVDRRGGLDYGLLDGHFQDLQKSLADIGNLVEGTPRFPLQATAKLGDIRPLQDSLANDIRAFIGLYEGESPDVKTPAVLRWPVTGRALLDQLTRAQTRQAQLLAAAKANYAQSQDLKKKGQDLIPSIDTDISINSAAGFAKADADLANISNYFSQSLQYQEDVVFRDSSDTQEKALAKRIADARNKWLVGEVQKLVDSGSQAYLGQQFKAALTILQNAHNLWSTYYPSDPNPEVEYWLTLAGYANSVGLGRELTPLDPLYNEVQQLLNSAQRDYNLGMEQISAGRQQAGLDLLNRADESLGKIILAFPFNQKAHVLKLQVSKAVNPENFPILFKQQFDAAVASMKNDARAAQGDLEVLKSIQADYPGLDKALTDVNLLLFPPKKSLANDILKQVDDLLTRASRLYNDGRGTEAQLRNALTLVRQAQNLDPTNRAASRLSGSILTSLPPPTLSGEALVEFTRIQKLYLDSDFQGAKQRLNDLLKTYTDAGQVPQVIKLEHQIDANL